MKTTLLSTTLLALAGLALIAQPAAAQTTLSTNPTDLLLGFYSTSGTGATTDYEVDLGNASNFVAGGADAVGHIVTINTTGNIIGGNIATDLSTIYGSGWSTSANVNMAVAGSNFSPATSSGIAAQTLFASNAETTPGIASTPWTVEGANSQATFDALMNAMLVSNNHGYASGNTDSPNQTLSLQSSTAVIQSTSELNSFASYMPGGNNSPTGVAFKYFQNGISANFASGANNTVLDLYELTPNSAGGNGTLVGAFEMTSGGSLEFSSNVTSFAAVPEPSTYAAILGVFMLGFVAYRRRQVAKV